MNLDVIHTTEDDLMIQNGDFVIGESIQQEVGIILRLNAGELKEDPVLGPGLIRMIKGKKDNELIRQMAKLHLERDNKNFDKLKQYIKII